MFDEQLRKFLEYYKLKAAKSVPAYISANDISLIGLALTILAIFTYYMDWYILTFVIGVLAILTDGLDGGVARLRNSFSDYGAYLDITTDFVLYCGGPFAVSLKSGDLLTSHCCSFLLLSYAINAASSIFEIVLVQKWSSGNFKAKLPNRQLCEADTTYAFMTLVFFFESYAWILFLVYGIFVSIGIVKRTIELKELERVNKLKAAQKE